MLSLVPLTGYAGQISLAQMSFAGIGAYAVAQWGGGGNPLGVIAAAPTYALVLPYCAGGSLYALLHERMMRSSRGTALICA